MTQSTVTFRLLIILLGMCLFSSCSSQSLPTKDIDTPIAFPGAEGFGKYTTGGRGGRIILVTNLNDSGTGSLREAIEAKGPRYILFEVSGTIALESVLKINNGDVTITGQSAPGDGICLRNYNVSIRCDNVVIRYLRFRLGDENGQQDDAITCLRQKNIIIDHCSMSWATDECASFYDNENFTLQWSLISESLNHSVHEKGDHGYGGIWGGKGASFHHNLLAHHVSRLPRFCGSRYHKQPEKEIVDFRNNVIYNWKSNSSYAGERGNHNMINNYYKAGPSTVGDSKRSRIVEPYSPFGKFFIEGNYVDGYPAVTNNNWNGGILCKYLDSVRINSPIAVSEVQTQSAKDAYVKVLEQAGANLHRDDVDSRIINEVKNGTSAFGKNKDGIIDSQNDVGGWPVLKQGKVLMDKDRDGMPDEWEIKNKLNPEDVADGSSFTLSKSYPNIEVYLNALVNQ